MRNILILVALSWLAGCASHRNTAQPVPVALTHSDGSSVDWELLPFPKDSDWHGYRGRPAEIGTDGQIRLHNQPILSRQTYTLPATIECDLTCPFPSEAQSGCYIAAYSPDQANDMNTRDSVAVSIACRKGDPTRFVVFAQQNKNSIRADILGGEKPIPLVSGKTYHCRLTFTARETRLDIAGQSYTLDGVVVPYDQFKIWVFGFEMTDPWRFSDFTVR